MSVTSIDYRYDVSTPENMAKYERALKADNFFNALIELNKYINSLPINVESKNGKKKDAVKAFTYNADLKGKLAEILSKTGA